MSEQKKEPLSTNQISDTDARVLDAAYNKISWHIIPLLILGYIVAHLDRSNIGFARIQMLGDLGLSEVIYGLGAGLFYLGYSMFEIPSNLLLKKIGARLTFARIMIIWAIISASFALVTSAIGFTVLRFLLGCAEAGFFPGVLLYITFWIPARRRARFTALFMSALVISGLIGAPISGLILGNLDGFIGLRGWQWLFIIEAIPSVILGIIVMIWMSDEPSQASWLTEKEKTLVRGDLEKENNATIASGEKRSQSLGETFKDYRLYVLGMMAAALVSGIGGLAFWLPAILRQAGVENVTTLGFLAGLPYLIALVAQQWVAHHSDKVGERRWHVAICAIICGTSWLLLPFFSDQPLWSLLFLTSACVGAFGATGPFWSMPADILSRSASAGGIAIVSSIGAMFAFLSPIIVGWGADKTGSLALGQIYYGCLFLVAAMVLIVGTRSQKALKK